MDGLGQIIEALGGQLDRNDQVRALSAVMLELPQREIPTEHAVHAGISARAILIPADTTLTGVETNLDNLCVVLGDIEVTTDTGVRRITGFALLPATRGASRAGRTFADTWWVTLHRTELTDVRAVEDEMTNEAHRLQTRQLALGGE
jgi:hypothetical protein